MECINGGLRPSIPHPNVGDNEKALAFRDRNPEEAEQAVRESKRLAKEALAEIRRSASTLRDNSGTFSLSQALTELANNMDTGQFSIELHIEGYEAGYFRQPLTTLYRPAQEGLTKRNKRRFAAQEVLVLLAQLAYNLIGWTQAALARHAPPWHTFGRLHMVRDVFHITGKVTLNQAHTFALPFVHAMSAWLLAE